MQVSNLVTGVDGGVRMKMRQEKHQVDVLWAINQPSNRDSQGSTINVKENQRNNAQARVHIRSGSHVSEAQEGDGGVKEARGACSGGPQLSDLQATTHHGIT